MISLGAYSAHAEPAALIRDTGCIIPTPTGFVFTPNDLVIETNSNSDVTVLKCKVSITDYSGGQFTDRDFLCGIVRTNDFVFTSDSHVTVSASGKATLTCKYKA
jgi:hypothetical protein